MNKLNLNITKKDIYIFLIAFFIAFIMFKHTPTIDYPIVHINPYKGQGNQNTFQEYAVSNTLYTPKYIFTKDIFNLPPPPKPTLPPLAQSLFVSNAVQLTGIFQRGYERFAVIRLPDGTLIAVHRGQKIPASLGGTPTNTPGRPPVMPSGSMPGLPSLPQLLGIHPPNMPPSPSIPSAPLKMLSLKNMKNQKGPFIKVIDVGPNYVSFSFLQKIPVYKGVLVTYKYKTYTKTLKIFDFEVKKYER